MDTVTPSLQAPFVIANWKMHGCYDTNRQLLDGLHLSSGRRSAVTVVLCPPFVYLSQLQELLDGSGLALGAQDLSDQPHGAYTGEVSAAMLVDCGCSYVIVGHSERRICYGEDDESIRRKLNLACTVGLCPVLCVGETAEQRQQGQAYQVVGQQLKALQEIVGAPYLVAYEPVWAIGSKQACAADRVAEMHGFIHRCLTQLGQTEVAVLYGGSIKPANAASIFAVAGVDGGLVGGASLQADDFLAICDALPAGA